MLGRSDRDAWDDLYAKRGLQFGGAGDLKPLTDRLEPGMRVLDVGCGEGKSLEVLPRHLEIVGCDFSREALVRLVGHGNVRQVADLVECDMRILPFDDEKFDAIVCVHALSHIVKEGRKVAAKELMRVLRPCGLLLLEVFDKEDLRFGQGDEVEQSSFLRGNGIMTHYFEKGEMASLFEPMRLLFETQSSKRVTFGAKAGKRSVLRIMLQSGE